MSATPEVHNTVGGPVSGNLVQAGTIYGGVAISADWIWPTPRQLPHSPGTFTGRADELAVLNKALDDGATEGATVVISALNGTGGVGKTWLALHWAYQNIERFPDGQLFVDLNGFHPTGSPMAPREAVHGFLTALDVPPDKIPAEEHAQVALYRTLLANRKVLIVLDNALDGAQVKDLVPGGGTCTVLITSRNRLAGLQVSTPFHPVDVEVLNDEAARELLARRLGEQRLDAEPEATAALLGCCAGLPLALSIVAAQVRQSGFSLTKQARLLREESERLAGLGGTELDSVQAVLSSSYRGLSEDQQKVFGLLGLAPGQDISVAAAASLAGLPESRVERILDELVAVSLLQCEHERYRMHDLLRLYASKVARSELSQREQELATQRLFDFYVHMAHGADRQLIKHHIEIELPGLLDGCVPVPPASEAEAEAWFAGEHANLMAAQHLAVQQGRDAAVWQLAWTMTSFNLGQGHLHDNHTMWRAGTAAAAQLSKALYRTQAYRHLGRACGQLGKHDEALQHLERGLEVAAADDDQLGQAHTHRAVASTYALRADYQQALRHSREALRLYDQLAHAVSGAHALNEIGWYTALLGDLATAQEHCAAALARCQQDNNQRGIPRCLLSLGYIAARTGDLDQAIDLYQQALELCRQRTDAATEADVLVHLGDALASRDPDAAQATREQALELFVQQRRGLEAERMRVLIGQS
ncbi:ATP-binding protein [Crossiella sp. CA198]|uniref:ATP-binding protein n=1 Tax=Crossiella sp. CA198 TaxID=3455607 RepID=UPI003F8D701B